MPWFYLNINSVLCILERDSICYNYTHVDIKYRGTYLKATMSALILTYANVMLVYMTVT